MIPSSSRREGEQPVTTFVPLFPWMSMQILTILTFEGEKVFFSEYLSLLEYPEPDKPIGRRTAQSENGVLLISLSLMYRGAIHEKPK